MAELNNNTMTDQRSLATLGKLSRVVKIQKICSNTRNHRIRVATTELVRRNNMETRTLK